MKQKYFSPKIFFITIFLQLCLIFATRTIYAVFTSKAYNFGNKVSTGTWAVPGPSGTSGETGPSGASGPSGVSGPSGTSGETGPSGVSGPSGISGETGPSGTSGETGPSGPSGIINKGLSFQAANSQYADAGSGTSFALTKNATWEFWINPKNITSDHTILSRWGSGASQSWRFSIYNYSPSPLLFAFLIDANDPNITLDQGAYISINMPTDTWYHVAWVFNGNGAEKADRLKLYINGQPQSLFFNGSYTNIPSILRVPAESVKIGGDGESRYFNGTIDNVSIWNISRSVSDIQNDYLNELNGNETGLVAYWKMNEGTGTAVSDSTANHNHGTLVNSPTWVGGYPQVVLNEMMPNPTIGKDWIEIYNRSNKTIDLTNWEIRDSGTTTPVETLSGTIDSNTFQIIDAGNRLNPGGDTIRLEDAGDYIMDTKTYGSGIPDDASIGRNPDGTGVWKNCASPSKGLTNNSSC